MTCQLTSYIAQRILINTSSLTGVSTERGITKVWPMLYIVQYSTNDMDERGGNGQEICRLHRVRQDS